MAGSGKKTGRKTALRIHQRRKARGRGAKQRPIVRIRRRPGISDKRLERGLRVLAQTKDIKAAARSIRVSVKRFERSAKRKTAIGKRKGFWTVVRRLPRKMPIFSGGRQLAITVRSNSATLIGRYNSAVAKFLRTNDPKFLVEFKGCGVKDVRGKFHEFTTDPNVLYRLSSAGNEPFEDIYRIVI
jgi:hypothetical protein